MGVNKVVYGSKTLIDLTGDTVTAATLAEGVTAHDASGNAIVGTMTGGGGGATMTVSNPVSGIPLLFVMGQLCADGVVGGPVEVSVPPIIEILNEQVLTIGSYAMGASTKNCEIQVNGVVITPKNIYSIHNPTGGIIGFHASFLGGTFSAGDTVLITCS